MTPAQASGHPDFITDVPVQGPTDQGLREADCWYIKNVLKTTHPACVDCGGGTIPMWAQQSLSPVRGVSAGIGERISFGGVGALGFALGAGDVWSSLSRAQQEWIVASLTKLNDQIMKSSGTSCPTWAPNIQAAAGCFKGWFNTNYGGKLTDAAGKPVYLSPTIEFDQPTLDALLTITGMHPQDFITPYPGGATPGAEKKLSTGAMVGIAAAGAAAIGTGIYYASKSSRRRR